VSLLAEQAADDAVLDVTGEPVAYARMLARVAEELRRRSLTTELAAGIVLSKGAFLRRVEAILSDRRDSLRRLSRRALALTVLAALLSLFLASALPLSERTTARLVEKDATEAQASVSVSVSGGKPDPAAPPAVTDPVETAKAELRQSSVKPVPLTKKEILQSVEALRWKIEDLSVSFTFDAVQGGDTPDFVAARMHQTVVTKGDKTYIDYQFGAAPKYQQPLFRREVAFNGERSTVHEVSRGVASVRTTRERETNTQGRGFFDLMLLNPPRVNGSGSDDQSLLSLLRSDLSLLREETEFVNGHRCYVLDVTHPSLGKTWMTVWLDADRGLLPIKQVHYFGKDLDLVILEFVVEDAVELEDGLWFAVRGYKRVGPVRADSRNPNWSLVHEMKVDGVDEDKPKIAVNTRIEDAFFDLWKRVPTGTRVVDFDAGTQRVFMSEQDAPKPPPQLGSPARELVLEEGAGVTLAQFRGKPVVVAFVSIYSRPCVKMLDDLKALQEKQGAEKLAVVAVHDRTATPEQIEEFRKDHSITFPVVRVPDAPRDGWDSETFRAYGVSALPTVVLVGAQGKVVSMGAGGELREDISRLMPKVGPSSSATDAPSGPKRIADIKPPFTFRIRTVTPNAEPQPGVKIRCLYPVKDPVKAFIQHSEKPNGAIVDMLVQSDRDGVAEFRVTEGDMAKARFYWFSLADDSFVGTSAVGLSPVEGSFASTFRVLPSEEFKILVLDEKGSPVPDARLWLWAEQPGFRASVYGLRSNSQGVAAVHFAAARTQVLARAKGYASTLAPPVDLSKVKSAEVRLPVGQIIAGRVVDEQGRPLEGVAVRGNMQGQLPWNEDYLLETRTDSQGRFELTNASALTYEVCPLFEDPKPPLYAKPLLIQVESDRRPAPVEFVARPGAALTGRSVPRAGNGPKVADNWIDATVSAPEGDWGIFLRTKEDGSFAIWGIPPDADGIVGFVGLVGYELVVTVPEEMPFLQVAPSQANIRYRNLPTGVHGGIEVHPVMAGLARGVVTDAGGHPLPNVAFWVFPTGRGLRTDGSGAYSCQVPSGRKVSFRVTDPVTAKVLYETEPFEVSEGEIIDRNLVIPDQYLGVVRYSVREVAHPAEPKFEVGGLAPPFEAETTEGAPLKLSDFRGKPMVLAFVSIYSRPCVKVLDDLKALQEKEGADKVGVIAVHDRTATPKEIEQFRKDHSIPFPIVRVPAAPRDGWDSETFRAYGVTALPTVVRIDTEGKVESVGAGLP
jgi:peroxiredoxin